MNDHYATLEQKRAKHAWQAVSEWDLDKRKDNSGQKGIYSDKAKDYAREARKLPSRILAAGLGQALAFLSAKAGPPNSREFKDQFGKLLEHLRNWVVRERKIEARTGDDPLAPACRECLLRSVIEGDFDFLRRATDEVLAYLVWLNRFAEAKGLTDMEEG